jgi:hypothetical protein
MESFGHMPWTETAGSYGRSIFSYLRILHIHFQSVYTVCLPTNSEWEFLLPHTLTSICCQFSFLILSILSWVRWNLRIALSVTSIMVEDDEHFLRTYYLFFISSSIQVYFLIGLFLSYFLECVCVCVCVYACVHCSLYNMNIILLSYE